MANMEDIMKTVFFRMPMTVWSHCYSPRNPLLLAENAVVVA